MPYQPPNEPWELLPRRERPRAALSYYYSDSLSRLPVRAVTLAQNNKSDPNFETATYGMFSTCEAAMRTGVRANNLSHIIFLTRIKGKGRAITGYYELGWFCQSPFSASKPDYCLAASRIHFVETPILVGETPPALRRLATARFRTYRYLTESATEEAIAVLDKQPNVVSDYIAEIKRLERINITHVGEPYVGWGIGNDGFSWELARQYLLPVVNGNGHAADANNVAINDLWMCSGCGHKVVNKARLKLCTNCSSVGTFVPSEK